MRFSDALTEAEVRYLAEHEWALTAEDVLWRRSKLGLRMTPAQAQELGLWMEANLSKGATPPSRSVA